MKLSQLKAIVKQGESQILEFKKTTGVLSAVLQTVCAFLNSKTGGTVLIGVKDNGEIIGQNVSDATQQEIAKELNKIEPNMTFDISYVPVAKELFVIVIMVKPGDKAPYVYDGRPYIRSQSTTSKMPQEIYEYLLRNRQPASIAWESLTTNKCTMNDLDKNRIRDFVHMGIASGRLIKGVEKVSISEILQKFDLLHNERLTNAAVILFCKSEQKQFIQSAVQLARFEGFTKSIFIDRKDIRGNIFELLEGAMKFLNFNLPIAGKIVDNSVYRVDTPAIPFNVLREALLNALVHRDYNLMGGSIDVAIYDDRVEIDSPGNLPAGIELRDLIKRHKSIKRNQLIANVVYTCGMIEKWGRGTLEMIETCKKAGNPIPTFEESSGSFAVIFQLKEPMRQFALPVKQETKIDALTDRQKAILEVLKQGLQSREQIIEKLNDTPSDRVVQKDLLKLNTLNLIIKSGGVTGRFVKWALNGEFNANSTRTQRELNANLTRTKRITKTKKVARKTS